MLNFNFKRFVADASLFNHHHHSAPIYLIVYVDDIILTSPDTHALDPFVKQLAYCFALKDLGSLSFFLGVEVVATTHGLFLSQKNYIIDLLHSRMKHLALNFYFVREQVQNGVMRVTHVFTGDQLTDALTKPLNRKRFEMLMSKIRLT